LATVPNLIPSGTGHVRPPPRGTEKGVEALFADFVTEVAVPR